MLFFDSYSIIEIIKGNENYKKFEKEVIFTTVMNLGEIYYFLLREYNKKTADYWHRILKFDFLEIKPEIVIKASFFKFLNRKRKLSFIDCIGYVMALEYKTPFLTGDEKFKGMRNVEFIK
ncbi:PIN domain-containing protein [Candidatus Pacearchaeota archaeon]|nr:PIN domain-containing protein [Candidatus Pacearchaeota archaeon]